MRLNNAMQRKGTRKHNTTLNLLGCSKEELHTRLQAMRQDCDVRFSHIDHIFPLAKHNIIHNDGQRRAMHFSNLQILTECENLDKSTRLPTKAMAAKVERWAWPEGITEDDLPEKYDGWATALRM